MTHNCNSVNHTHLVFRSVKAATEAWIALEDESEEEEIDGEEEEKEEETDVETDGRLLRRFLSSFNQQIHVCQCPPSTYESFSDVGEIRVWFASKILTPCRMH